MSGVSITSGAPDLDAIIAGGADFMARMQSFKEARDAAQQSLADLNLGKDARAAHDEAQRVLGEAKAKRDADLSALLVEITNTRASVKDWEKQTRGAAMATREQADALLVEAQHKHEVAAQTLADAQTKADEINGRVEALKQKFRSGHAALAAEVENL
jgi:hypothetical protein